MTKKPSVSNPLIYCIGDSHASFFAGADRIQPNWPTAADCYLPLFKVLKIGSSLAYSLSVEGSRTRGREQLFEVLETSVPQGAHVMLIFRRNRLPSTCFEASCASIRACFCRG